MERRDPQDGFNFDGALKFHPGDEQASFTGIVAMAKQVGAFKVIKPKEDQQQQAEIILIENQNGEQRAFSVDENNLRPAIEEFMGL